MIKINLKDETTEKPGLKCPSTQGGVKERVIGSSCMNLDILAISTWHRIEFMAEFCTISNSRPLSLNAETLYHQWYSDQLYTV